MNNLLDNVLKCIIPTFRRPMRPRWMRLIPGSGKMHSMPKIGAHGMILTGIGPKAMWLSNLKNLLQLTLRTLPLRKLNRLNALRSHLLWRLSALGQRHNVPQLL
jgi:hypothetical protein